MAAQTADNELDLTTEHVRETCRSTVKDLVAGSGIVFADRGERELKGVGGWRLYSVVPANKVEKYSFHCDVLSLMHGSLTVTP